MRLFGGALEWIADETDAERIPHPHFRYVFTVHRDRQTHIAIGEPKGAYALVLRRGPVRAVATAWLYASLEGALAAAGEWELRAFAESPVDWWAEYLDDVACS